MTNLLNLPTVHHLCVKYPCAVTKARTTQATLQSVEATSASNLVDQWKKQEADAQTNRNYSGGASMDIYDLKISKGV